MSPEEKFLCKYFPKEFVARSIQKHDANKIIFLGKIINKNPNFYLNAIHALEQLDLTIFIEESLFRKEIKEIILLMRKNNLISDFGFSFKVIIRECPTFLVENYFPNHTSIYFYFSLNEKIKIAKTSFVDFDDSRISFRTLNPKVIKKIKDKFYPQKKSLREPFNHHPIKKINLHFEVFKDVDSTIPKDIHALIEYVRIQQKRIESKKKSLREIKNLLKDEYTRQLTQYNIVLAEKLIRVDENLLEQAIKDLNHQVDLLSKD